MEAKQDQRLESLASGLSSINDGMIREGILPSSPRSHRSHAGSVQPSPETRAHALARSHARDQQARHRPPPEIPAAAAAQLRASQLAAALQGGAAPEVAVPPLPLNARGLEALAQQELQRQRRGSGDRGVRGRAPPPQHSATPTLGPLATPAGLAAPAGFIVTQPNSGPPQRPLPNPGPLGPAPPLPPAVAAKLGCAKMGDRSRGGSSVASPRDAGVQPGYSIAYAPDAPPLPPVSFTGRYDSSAAHAPSPAAGTRARARVAPEVSACDDRWNLAAAPPSPSRSEGNGSGGGGGGGLHAWCFGGVRVAVGPPAPAASPMAAMREEE